MSAVSTTQYFIFSFPLSLYDPYMYPIILEQLVSQQRGMSIIVASPEACVGVTFWGKDYSILGSILGSPCFGNLPSDISQ